MSRDDWYEVLFCAVMMAPWIVLIVLAILHLAGPGAEGAVTFSPEGNF